METPSSQEYSAVADRYAIATGQEMSIWSGFLYDASMLLGKTMLAMNTTDVNVLYRSLPSSASEIQGITGSLSLNEYGDRRPLPFEIWGYGIGSSGEVEFVRYGSYIPDLGETVWK